MTALFRLWLKERLGLWKEGDDEAPAYAHGQGHDAGVLADEETAFQERASVLRAEMREVHDDLGAAARDLAAAVSGRFEVLPGVVTFLGCCALGLVSIVIDAASCLPGAAAYFDVDVAYLLDASPLEIGEVLGCSAWLAVVSVLPATWCIRVVKETREVASSDSARTLLAACAALLLRFAVGVALFALVVGGSLELRALAPQGGLLDATAVSPKGVSSFALATAVGLPILSAEAFEWAKTSWRTFASARRSTQEPLLREVALRRRLRQLERELAAVERERRRIAAVFDAAEQLRARRLRQADAAPRRRIPALGLLVILLAVLGGLSLAGTAGCAPANDGPVYKRRLAVVFVVDTSPSRLDRNGTLREPEAPRDLWRALVEDNDLPPDTVAELIVPTASVEPHRVFRKVMPARGDSDKNVGTRKREFAALIDQRLSDLAEHPPEGGSDHFDALSAAARDLALFNAEEAYLYFVSDLRDRRPSLTSRAPAEWNFQYSVRPVPFVLSTLQKEKAIPDLRGVHVVVCGAYAGSRIETRWNSASYAALIDLWTSYFAATGAADVEIREVCASS